MVTWINFPFVSCRTEPPLKVSPFPKLLVYRRGTMALPGETETKSPVPQRSPELVPVAMFRLHQIWSEITWVLFTNYTRNALCHIIINNKSRKVVQSTLSLNQCFRKRNLAMRTWRSKALQWGKRDLLSKMRPKCGPILELLRTQESLFSSKRQKVFKEHILVQKCKCFFLW